MIEIDYPRLRKEYDKDFKDPDFAEVKPIIPFLKTNVSPWLIEEVTAYTTTKQEITTKRLAQLRTFNGKIRSRPATCAEFIRVLWEPYEKAQSYLDQGRRGHFYVWYTLAEGKNDFSFCIDRAEGVIRNGVNAEVLHVFGEGLPENLKQEEVTQRFQLYSRKLIADPTGISLMEYQVFRCAQSLFDLPDCKNAPCFDVYHPVKLFAAMYAAEVYKTIYPLSE